MNDSFWIGGYDAYLSARQKDYDDAFARLLQCLGQCETDADRQDVHTQIKKLKEDFKADRRDDDKLLF
tara:strand:- start:10989 stop:11192 length:204 start_codon:yes stop_codon:yes gene_type:complete